VLDIDSIHSLTMHFKTLLVSALFAVDALAAPAPLSQSTDTQQLAPESKLSKRSFSVARRAARPKPGDGHRSLAKAYARYGFDKSRIVKLHEDDLLGSLLGGDVFGTSNKGTGTKKKKGGKGQGSSNTSSGTDTSSTAVATLAAAAAHDGSAASETSGSSATAAAAAPSADASGSVAATSDQGDSSFLAPVTIGGQLFTMDFDTGSSDL
jgi:hypothetical protein